MVLQHIDGNIPRIGDSLKAGEATLKILDVIGPVSSPFIIAKPLRGDIEGEVELSPIRKRRAKVRRSRKGRR
ncbi:hypothetical protein IPA_04545 [Ignicoccus pacificus DSM 13166]|uniref:H/ACA RNA-protein complex protein Gar1 n=1 Tax=Ignicoccus pacificus DSM 13166 TaxID=940294 RepID=A0A977KB47_9CREN|nr:hypothetical protein IPA_04545 [Ignicoccus pacificus DSM 13166]